MTIHLLALVLLLVQTNASHSVVGKWESVEPTDGPRAVLEFGRGGRFVAAAGMSVSGTYRLDGNRILIDEEMGSERLTESVELRIEAEALVMISEKPELKFLRLNRQAPKTPATVGKWGLKGPFFHGDNALVDEFLINRVLTLGMKENTSE